MPILVWVRRHGVPEVFGWWRTPPSTFNSQVTAMGLNPATPAHRRGRDRDDRPDSGGASPELIGPPTDALVLNRISGGGNRVLNSAVNIVTDTQERRLNDKKLLHDRSPSMPISPRQSSVVPRRGDITHHGSGSDRQRRSHCDRRLGRRSQIETGTDSAIDDLDVTADGF